MRISVTRSGGFAGLTRTAALDTAGRADAARLHALAREALSAPAAPEAAPAPDGLRYLITVDGAGVRCAEPHLTGAQRALVRAVLAEGAAG